MTSPADPSTDQLRARLRETIERAPDEQLRTVAAYFEVAGVSVAADAPPVPGILSKPNEEQLRGELAAMQKADADPIPLAKAHEMVTDGLR